MAHIAYIIVSVTVGGGGGGRGSLMVNIAYIICLCFRGGGGYGLYSLYNRFLFQIRSLNSWILRLKSWRHWIRAPRTEEERIDRIISLPHGRGEH